MSNKKVLLTGVTGFLGSHTAIQLLNKGYEVIGTLRDKSRADSIRKVIAKHTNNISNLSFAEAELSDGNVWLQLTKDVDFVQHIASPFPRELPKHENDLIIPARDGVLNILKASSINKIKRVVLTSSIAAVVYGKTKNELNNNFDEKDWTDETNKKDTAPYYRSKTIAEKAAWEFIKNDVSGMELVTVLPGGILGPILESDFGTSANIVLKVLEGKLPAVPKIGFEIIDVRSVADLLIRAMEMPQAAGKRYIATSGYLLFKDIAKMLKEAYPNRKIKTSELPNILVKLFSNFETSLKPIIIDLGIVRKIKTSKAQDELQWKPLSAKEAVMSCAESIFETGIIK